MGPLHDPGEALEVDPLRATAMVWVLALGYVPIYGAVAGSRLFPAPAGEVLGQLLYQGVGVAIGALVLYTMAIRTLGAAIASLFMPLIPVFGVLLAIPVLDEVPTPVQVVGMLAVAAGGGGAVGGLRDAISRAPARGLRLGLAPAASGPCRRLPEVCMQVAADAPEVQP